MEIYLHQQKNHTGVGGLGTTIRLRGQNAHRRRMGTFLIAGGPNNVRTSTFSAGDLPPMYIDEK